MPTDDQLIEQLKQSFHSATDGLAPGPELLPMVRRRASRQRTTRIAAAGSATVLTCALIFATGAIVHARPTLPAELAASAQQSTTAAATATSHPRTPATSPAEPNKPSTATSVKPAAPTTPAVSGSALIAGDLKVQPGQYLHVRTHSYDITVVNINHGSSIPMFTEGQAEQWIAATPGQLSYDRVDSPIATTFLTSADRAEVADNNGISERGTTWYSVNDKGDQTQIYPAGGVAPTEAPLTCTGTSAACAALQPSEAVWDMPTAKSVAKFSLDPVALRADLYRYASAQYKEIVSYGKKANVDDIAFAGAAGLLAMPVLSSELRVALASVAKTVPRSNVIESLANYDGQKGTAISHLDRTGIKQDLIFDPTSNAYIGGRMITTTANTEYSVPTGTVLHASAVDVSIAAATPTLPTGTLSTK